MDALPSFALGTGVLLVDGAVGLLANWANGTRQQGRYAAWSVANAWSRPLCAAALGWLMGPLAWVVVAGHLAGAILAGTLLRPPSASKNSKSDWTRRIEPEVARFGRPFAAMAWVGWVTNLGDRYVLAAFHGNVDVGIYVAAYALASQPFSVLGAFLAVWLRPALFDAAARGDDRRSMRLLLIWGVLAVGLGAAGVAVLGTASSLIVRLLLGPRFREAAPLLVFIGAAYALQTVQQVFETVLQLRHETWKMLVAQVVNASVAAVGYFILIPGGGARGAAIATVAGFASSTALACVMALGAGGLAGRPLSGLDAPDEHVTE
jgi:O-antigen/teichoic acid export membrane protein